MYRGSLNSDGEDHCRRAHSQGLAKSMTCQCFTPLHRFKKLWAADSLPTVLHTDLEYKIYRTMTGQ